jgi:predicted RNA binding protein YcfA (HicA-like mRNA interferase family)
MNRGTMPKKVRELKAILLKVGFVYIPAKGSHGKWRHPNLFQAIIIAGKDGSDAKRYLEKQVAQAIQALSDQEGNSSEEES